MGINFEAPLSELFMMVGTILNQYPADFDVFYSLLWKIFVNRPRTTSLTVDERNYIIMMLIS